MIKQNVNIQLQDRTKYTKILEDSTKKDEEKIAEIINLKLNEKNILEVARLAVGLASCDYKMSPTLSLVRVFSFFRRSFRAKQRGYDKLENEMNQDNYLSIVLKLLNHPEGDINKLSFKGILLKELAVMSLPSGDFQQYINKFDRDEINLLTLKEKLCELLTLKSSEKECKRGIKSSFDIL